MNNYTCHENRRETRRRRVGREGKLEKGREYSQNMLNT